MDIEEEVKELIDCHAEGDYLDFKEDDYSKENKAELVKDLIALANSHSGRNKYIIIGIKEKNNVCEEIKGIDKTKIRDEAAFQQIVKTYIKENLIVEYKLINIDNEYILVIKIPNSNNINRPFMVKTQLKTLKENEIYIRKGSSTDLANKKDLEYMFKENKNSKLIVQSYLDGNLSNKILLSEINPKIENYKKSKLKEIKQIVNDISKLKGKKFLFAMTPSFFLSNEEVQLDQDKEKFIKEKLDELKIVYDDSIFEFKNVKWKSTFGGGLNPISKTLYGDKDEIDRYWKLKDLHNYILEYLAISYYFKYLPPIYSTNLLISNIGNCFDEDIELKLIIDKKVFVEKSIFIINDNVIKYLGIMYDDLREELIKCPRISSIDEYDYPSFVVPHITQTNIPQYIENMYSSEPTYLDTLEDKANDFKDDLEDIFVDSIYEEKDKIIIKTNFKKIMHNKSMFLEAKLLFNRNKIKIDYEIKSKNNANTIYGTIES